ncbi:RNA polymerase-associated protein RapA [Desulfosarcina ovata subsp. sediminis]|uniref:RNA polymerase-associated protein RapA n=1 Tax=Desulfosarcina ovata subsp. sediminis TaxID=885957 RepID=A0A5K7ZYR6_9BACT|nr:RNA polymerase-associated protein RapA [Desulfosarcina ovata]BBO85415.1 RNA polymerase-associated protein RapA [Desulfosarcina ovata subsp. sediminis]
MFDFVPGQRWSSEMEPELGIGIVDAVDGRRVHLRFPDSGLLRIYAAHSAPLQRAVFHPGDRVTGENGVALTVTRVETVDGLTVYHGDGMRLAEDRLVGTPALDTPKARLLAGQRDLSSHFDLRRRILDYRCRMTGAAAQGFIGGRVELIPHQFAIAAEVSSRRFPRVLLADETGLGKTIEAGLVLHRLVFTGRIHRALVIVPDALVVQWFVELARRFNLQFRIFDEETISVRPAPTPPMVDNPFAEEPLGLCGFSFVRQATPTVQERLLEGEWDMVVVDEAHHMQPGDPLFRRIQRLGRRAPRMILITATPGHLAARGHFARLRLLDPHRYGDYERFKTESATFGELARMAQMLDDRSEIDPAARARLGRLLDMPPARLQVELNRAAGRQKLMHLLIDRHGTGRVMFKTTRRTVTGFPGRRAHLIPLDPDAADGADRRRISRECLDDGRDDKAGHPVDFTADPRVAWLDGYLRTHRDVKILLICRTAQKVNALYDALDRRINASIGRYHEQMTLVQRDRNAAWFADPQGATLLLCSEIGSEGRNFQSARHLVLFDLPWDAELLEQRIGRLDRIGQTGVVQVMVPYVRGTGGEVLARWYHEAMGAFEATVPASGWVMQRMRKVLMALIDNPAGPVDPVRLNRIIRSSRVAVSRQQRRIDTGRDCLLELDALPPDRVAELLDRIRAVDGDPCFQELIEPLLDIWGITMEPLADGAFRLTPDHRYANPLPGFRPSGMNVTLDRSLALAREDLGFLTWDHPLVTGAMDQYLGSGKGSTAFSHVPGNGVPEIFLEMLFVIESTAATDPFVSAFLPPAPIRVVVDHLLKDGSAALPDSTGMAEASAKHFARLLPVVSRLIPDMVAAGQRIAEETARPVIAAARQNAHQTMDDTVSRLQTLSRVNSAIGPAEIDGAIGERDAVLAAVDAATVRLDALRLVTRGDFP